MRTTAFAVLILALLASCCAGSSAPALDAGRWQAWLESPGGDLPFGIDIVRGGDTWQAFLVNGSERVAVETVEFRQGRLRLGIARYDAEIVASWDAGQRRLNGSWRRTAGPRGRSELPFHAVADSQPGLAAKTAPPVGSVAGRWSVDFEQDALPAVGLFEMSDDGAVEGTFLTATGDYRFLSGRMDGDRLRLSTFDGAHAFLFDARLRSDGSLAGDFWSRDTWHETWTARPDPDAAVPDSFAQTRWVEDVDLGTVTFPDLDGRLHALDEYSGRARIIVIFGSWCPNCNDATSYFVELDKRYRGQGLSILGLAFEMTGSFERDTAQVRRYAGYHGIDFPVLLAGTAEKAEASKAFPLIDRVRAFPTTLFLDADDRVRAVHSGYYGPAAGEAYLAQRVQFEKLIEGLLGLADPAAGRRRLS